MTLSFAEGGMRGSLSSTLVLDELTLEGEVSRSTDAFTASGQRRTSSKGWSAEEPLNQHLQGHCCKTGPSSKLLSVDK